MILKHLIEGWRNTLSPKEAEKEIIKAVSEERLKICNTCHFHSKNHKSMRPDAHCTHCSCTLSVKTKCLSCRCPLPEPAWVEFKENE